MKLSSVQRLSGGLSNSSFRISFESGKEPVVLRLYERDRDACRKELELLSSLSRTVPVPEVLHAEPDAQDPFMFLRYVDGITFRELKATANKRAIQDAAYSIGAVLATIGKQDISHYVHVSQPDTGILESIESNLKSSALVERLGKDLTNRVRELFDDWAKPLRRLENERQLVHGDFRKQNVLVRFDGVRWNVAAILDWECAFLGSPLIDVGLFLRYEDSDNPIAEPAFSEGFRDGGGKLPDDWVTLRRILDLESLCRSLASPNIPLDIEHEIAGLVSRTVMEFESICV